MPVRSIPEHYSLKLILHAPDKLIRDVGNYEKVSSDFLQMARIVRNDCLCLDLHVVWGSSADAPHGARMIVSPMELEGTY
jgi:hypothetical protein